MATLPGSSAAPRKGDARASAEAPRALPIPAQDAATFTESGRGAHGLVSSPLLTPAAFFQAAPIETFEADCTTPQTSFSLGNTICVKVDGAPTGDTPLERIVLGNTAGFIVDSSDITTASQTVTFTLPSASTSGGVDNRGSWIVGIVETSDATLSRAIMVTVHDPAQQVADLTISKFQLGGDAPVAGTDVSYELYIWNRGPDSAANAHFANNTLPNTTFVSLTQNSGPTFNCTSPAVGTAGTSNCTAPGPFAKGDTAVFTVVYHVNIGVGDGAELNDTATVDSTTYDSAPSSNSSDVTANASNPSPPPCTLSCPENITAEAAQGQTSAQVTFAAPTLGGTCGTVTTTPASGSTFPIGSTVVTSTTSDGFSCSFVVTVTPYQDSQDPSITCPADITVDESSSSANSAKVTYSVTASDDSGSVSVSCDPPSGSSFPVGTTAVRCTATDPSGNSSSCSFNVTVNDIACSIDANSPAPVPNVAQLPTISRACSVTLIAADDPTATDACGGTISGDTASDRFYNVPGTYTVVWTYTDSAGHTTTQNQTIIIEPDNSAPVPDAASLPTVTGECSAAITGDPPTATDNCAGSGIVGVPLDPLSYNTAGTHVVRWKFTDPAGNSTIQTQTVIVTDTHPPTVTLTGPSSVTVECHTSYTDAGATTSDNCSAAPSLASSSDVNVNAPGTYHVTWTATDGGGNTASATRTVIVVDTIKPVITLNGANPVTILLHSTYVDPGATAADSCAGSFAATASGAVNTNAVGTYIITYNATDPAGNAADPVTRTVYVIYDFSGFFSPINNNTINQANAGRSIPVKFSLAGDQGLGIMAAGSPYSQQVTCGSSNVTDLQETGTAGSSSLAYDASSGQYIYVWKTESSWAGTCRVLTVKLIDGTTHTANFKFK